MDQARFDSLAKRFARDGSRRGFLRGLARAGAAIAAARLGFAARSADARQCRDYGCFCNAVWSAASTRREAIRVDRGSA